MVVSRNTVPAAQHATRAVTALSGEVRVRALVVVSDGAGAEPKDATARFGLLVDRVGGLVRMPFVPALRQVDEVNDIELPSRVRRSVESIRGLAFAS